MKDNIVIVVPGSMRRHIPSAILKEFLQAGIVVVPCEADEVLNMEAVRGLSVDRVIGVSYAKDSLIYNYLLARSQKAPSERNM